MAPATCAFALFVSKRMAPKNITSETPSFSAFRRITAAASGSVSTKVADAAPRDSASNPSAPLPANKSATRKPSNVPRRLASIENKVSRTRSVVGRVSSPRGASIVRPRHLPAMILISGTCGTSRARIGRLRRHLPAPGRPVSGVHKPYESAARPAAPSTLELGEPLGSCLQ